MSLKRSYFETAQDSSSTQDIYAMGAKQSNLSSQSKRSKRSFSQSSKTSKQLYTATPNVYTENKYTPPPMPPSIPTSQFDTRQCELWFQQYVDPDMPDTISPEGTQKFFEDLGLSLEDITVLILAWKMNIANMGYITKNEWMQGMQSLGTDSREKLLQKQSAIGAIKDDPQSIRDIYNYSFAYAKDKNQKCMDVDARKITNIVFLDTNNNLAEQQVRPVKVINKDQWQNFYDFVTTISPDLDDYDEMSAWPVLFDEFVEWKRGTKDQQ